MKIKSSNVVKFSFPKIDRREKKIKEVNTKSDFSFLEHPRQDEPWSEQSSSIVNSASVLITTCSSPFFQQREKIEIFN